MRAQRSRADVPPLAWEVPAALVSSWPLLGVLALPTGQGMSASLGGNGYAAERRTRGVSGRAVGVQGRGLTPEQASGLPSTSVVYLTITILEFAVGRPCRGLG